MKDSRGVERGACTRCTDCSSYKLKELDEASNKPSPCVCCGCPPGSHENLDKKEGDSRLSVSATGKLARDSFSTCLLCTNEAHLDVNTGEEFKYCEEHLAGLNFDSDEEDSTSNGLNDSSSQDQPASIPQARPISSQAKTCAIEECSNPRYVDANGTEHECCGYTHAMELIRRKTLERKFICVMSILKSHGFSELMLQGSKPLECFPT